MPLTLDADFVAGSQPANLSVALEPAHNILNSMLLLNAVEKLSGLDEWVTRTAARLSPEQLHRNQLVFEGLYYAVQPDRRWPSFSTYLDDLAAKDPVILRDRLLWQLSRMCITETQVGVEPAQLVEPRSLLTSLDTYLSYLQANFAEIDVAIETETYVLLSNPPKMKDLIVSHVGALWHEQLAGEWERVKPLLQESVGAFQHIDLSRMNGFEALRTVTGQEPHDKWERLIGDARQIIFVPSAHLGPYLRKFSDNKMLWVIFGARLPEGVQAGASALSRSDLLVRLSALTDDTRLRMLALLSQHDELCAQDIMVQLDLSQSAASRHLRQLSATGYITERRRDAAKCYSLNRDRIDDTFRALNQFFTRP
jgi:DNA-binding transcriptional ArsR family regulator